MSTLLLKVIDSVKKAPLELVDFGGGDAIAYREIASELPKHVNYTLVELPEIYYKYKDAYIDIQWSLTLPKRSDIIYCDASLQYVNLQTTLLDFIETNPQLIVLRRTPIGQYKTKFVIQPHVTYGYDNVPGKQWMYNIDEVNYFLLKYGFELQFFEKYDALASIKYTRTPELNFLRKRNNLIYSKV